jgi:hypothetical protein
MCTDPGTGGWVLCFLSAFEGSPLFHQVQPVAFSLVDCLSYCDTPLLLPWTVMVATTLHCIASSKLHTQQAEPLPVSDCACSCTQVNEDQTLSQLTHTHLFPCWPLATPSQYNRYTHQHRETLSDSRSAHKYLSPHKRTLQHQCAHDHQHSMARAMAQLHSCTLLFHLNQRL